MENFNFKGFMPSDSLKQKADRSLDKIVEQAPFDATITASIAQEGGLYFCTIEVSSATCNFLTETSHKTAGIAIDKAELNTLRRLDRLYGSKFFQIKDAPTRIRLREAN